MNGYRADLTEYIIGNKLVCQRVFIITDACLFFGKNSYFIRLFSDFFDRLPKISKFSVHLNLFDLFFVVKIFTLLAIWR